MDVNVTYKIVQYACAKNTSQGYVSPDDFNGVLMPMAQRAYLDFFLGEYQKYQPQRPIAVVEFGQNERLRDSIAPLIYGTDLFPSTTTGIAPFPSDYEYPDNMWGLYGFYNIRFAQQDRLDSYIHSSIDPIVENPIYLIQHEGFHFFPENIGSARLSYVRTPPAIVWGYVEDSNGVPVYDPSTSQQPVWSDTDMYQIIIRALALVGVNLQLNVLIGYANDIKNNGQ
jgi:hypothetical protein